MVITKDDVKMERRAEREDLAEVDELRAAIRGLPFQGNLIPRDSLEKAARLVLDARVHNAKLARLSEKLFKDLSSFRGIPSGRQRGKDRFLTQEEGRILATTKNITPHLSNIANNLDYMIHLTKTHGHDGGNYISTNSGDAGKDVDSKLGLVRRDIQNLIGILRGLFALEKQLEAALNR